MPPAGVNTFKKQFPNGIYDGEMVGEQRSGQGNMTYINGEIYNGEWVRDSRHGLGIQKWPGGMKYEGRWHTNQREGKGKLELPSGVTYEGFFTADKMGHDLAGWHALRRIFSRGSDARSWQAHVTGWHAICGGVPCGNDEWRPRAYLARRSPV